MSLRQYGRLGFVGAVLLTALPGGRPLCAQVQDSAGPRPSSGTLSGRAIRAAKAVRTASPIQLDGRLDEVAWHDAPAIADFIQHEPFEGQDESERSEIRFLYDDQALYIGAWLHDRTPAAIVQGEKRRDTNLKDMDALLLILDTFHDRQNGFVFGTTPAGVEYDGQVTKEGDGSFGSLVSNQTRGSGGGFNLNWDGSWQVATTRDDHGWYAEFRIPFTTLRYGKGGRQVWGLNVARHLRRRNEQAFWAPVPRQYDLYRVSLAGTLELEAPFRRQATVTPYVLGAVTRDFAGTPRTDGQAEAGGDAKVALTPSLALDLTYNTDFAQVEVDDQQVNLTRFNLFFPEKRPFFLENAGTFSVGTPETVELFFSRRVGIGPAGRQVPIVGGGRLTGRAAGLTIGLLDIQTEGLDSTLPANNFAVVRAVRELPHRSRVGAIAVSRVSTGDADNHNFTFGLDGRLGVGEAVSVDLLAARTETPGHSGNQMLYDASATYKTALWEAAFAFRDVGEDFNPEAGFLSRTSYRFVNARVLRHIRTPRVSWFREVRPHVTYREFFDRDGFTTTRLLHIDNHFEFANGSFFQLPALNLTREGLRTPFRIADSVQVPPGTYDNREIGFTYNTNLSAPVSLQGRITVGGFYTGHRKGTGGTLTVRSGATAAAALRFDVDDVTLPQGSFTTLLTGLRLSYAFTPRIFLQSLVQYNNQTDHFSGNLRFGWMGTAGTGLFVVLNDLERTGAASGPEQRAVIVKMTRQFEVR